MSATIPRLHGLRRPGVESTRARLRRSAAILSSAIAALYGLIALHVVTVIDGPATQVARDQLGFAAPAAVLFVVGVWLLVRYDDRRLWAVGAVLQLLIIAMYVAVAPDRRPTFEFWGLAIRVLQVGLLVPLVLLAVRRPVPLADRER